MACLRFLSAIASVVIVALLPGAAFSQTPPPEHWWRGQQSEPTVIHQTAVSGITMSGEFDLVAVIVDWPQGLVSAVPIHGGPSMGTVLEGEMTFASDAQPERTYRSGESFIVQPWEYGVASSKGTTARISLTAALPKGASLTVRATPAQTPPPEHWWRGVQLP